MTSYFHSIITCLNLISLTVSASKIWLNTGNFSYSAYIWHPHWGWSYEFCPNGCCSKTTQWWVVRSLIAKNKFSHSELLTWLTSMTNNYHFHFNNHFRWSWDNEFLLCFLPQIVPHTTAVGQKSLVSSNRVTPQNKDPNHGKSPTGLILSSFSSFLSEGALASFLIALWWHHSSVTDRMKIMIAYTTLATVLTFVNAWSEGRLHQPQFT